jgi:hypothetical protein
MKKIILILLVVLSSLTINAAPPSSSVIHAALQQSEVWKAQCHALFCMVAKDRIDVNYTGTSSIEIKRTAFARKILEGDKKAIQKAVNYTTSTNFIADLNDPVNSLDQVKNAFDSFFDIISESF